MRLNTNQIEKLGDLIRYAPINREEREAILKILINTLKENDYYVDEDFMDEMLKLLRTKVVEHISFLNDKFKEEGDSEETIKYLIGDYVDSIPNILKPKSWKQSKRKFISLNFNHSKRESIYSLYNALLEDYISENTKIEHFYNIFTTEVTLSDDHVIYWKSSNIALAVLLDYLYSKSFFNNKYYYAYFGNNKFIEVVHSGKTLNSLDLRKALHTANLKGYSGQEAIWKVVDIL